MTIRHLALAAVAIALAAGCRSPAPDAVYRPTESVLEVLSLLRLHVNDDTYRFAPARDFTGKNIYFASLARLERLEEIHEDKLRAGYLAAPVLFGKGLALERMGEFELAARHYERVTELETELAQNAQHNRDVCERLAEARPLRPEPDAQLAAAGAVFDQRVELLEILGSEVEGEHYRFVVREEIERAERERAEYFSARAGLDPRLDVVALQQYQRLVQRHPESKERNRNLLDLADQYALLSRRYVSHFPPTTLGFDPATFDEYAFGATRLYEVVSQQDGAIEKIEAARKLEAFMAFTLQVHHEKLPNL